MSKGYVYVLSNPEMPGLVKVGMTTRTVTERAKEISDATGVPVPFKIEFEAFVPNCQSFEADLHDNLREFRVSERREFFRCEPGRVVNYIEVLQLEYVRGLVQEFLPDYDVVNPDCIVGEPDVGAIAFAMQESTLFVASAMSRMTPEEVRPALQRWSDRVEAKKEEHRVATLRAVE